MKSCEKNIGDLPLVGVLRRTAPLEAACGGGSRNWPNPPSLGYAPAANVKYNMRRVKVISTLRLNQHFVNIMDFISAQEK